jgi:hypothetical protein
MAKKEMPFLKKWHYHSIFGNQPNNKPTKTYNLNQYKHLSNMVAHYPRF